MPSSSCSLCWSCVYIISVLCSGSRTQHYWTAAIGAVNESNTRARELKNSVRSHRRFRGIEWNGVKIYDLQKVTFSTLFKLYIAGLGVLLPKRYHMWV